MTRMHTAVGQFVRLSTRCIRSHTSITHSCLCSYEALYTHSLVCRLCVRILIAVVACYPYWPGLVSAGSPNDMLQRVARAAGSVAARCIASDLLPVTRAAACGCSSSYSDSHSWQHRGQRSYAEIAEEPVEVRVPGAGNERVQKLVEEIVNLNLLEVADLTELLRQRLGLGAMAGMMPQMGAPQQAAPAQVEEAPAAKEEQTDFDIVLDGFGASDKIKVIKEVRAVLPELGLKDAKVLVEKTPAVIKTGLKKEEAEALKSKLEAVGGKITLK